MTALKAFVTLSLVFLISACATTYSHPSLTLRDESDYYSTLERYTEHKQVYSGFYATIDFSASLLNSEVIKYQVDQNARIFQWNAEQYSNEKSKAETKLSKQTDVFLSFFTPERKNDDLNKAKTNWRVFLDVNGKRYDGKVERIKAQFSEITALYPRHNRWSTPYRLIFDVPSAVIEGSSAKLTLTGPVGSTSIDFKPLEVK